MFLVVLLFILINFERIPYAETIEFIYFDRISCSDSNVETILRTQALQESHQRSLIKCAISCSTLNVNLNTYCQFAVYRASTSSCKLIGNYLEHLADLPEYSQEDECTVLYRIDSADQIADAPSCQNGGLFQLQISSICACPKEFTGRYCEIKNPSSCQGTTWRLATLKDSHWLDKSHVPITQVIERNHNLLVQPVTAFDFDGNVTIVQVHNYLHMNYWDGDLTSGFFRTPFKMKFARHNLVNSEYALSSANIMFDGNTVITEQQRVVKYFIPSVEDEVRLVFDSANGSIKDITKALANGHRLLQRYFTRVGFDVDNDDAFYENVQTRLNINVDGLNTDWVTPLSYHSFKESLKTNKRYVRDTVVADPSLLNSYEEMTTPHWEMDQCWSKINPTENYDEFTSVLKEYVTSGKDIRVVLDGKISSDVVEICAIQNDVIAQLAPFLGPFDSSSGLSSRLHRQVISRSKHIAECVTEFQGSHVYSNTDGIYSSNIDWFVSTKPWTKILSISNTGEVLYGQKDILMEASSKGKIIRVCVHFEEWNIVCQGSSATRDTVVKGVGYHIQTPEVFQLQYSADTSEFKKILDSDCRRYRRQISAEGWIQRAELIMGSTQSDFVNEVFLHTEWFVEE